MTGLPKFVKVSIVLYNSARFRREELAAYWGNWRGKCGVF